MADIFDIAGRINSTSQEKVVTTADQIKDEIQNKKQNVINADVARHENEIHGTGGIDSRLDDLESMEQIVIDGGDAQIATGSDFDDPNSADRAKIPTVGAVLDGLNDGVYDVSKRNPTGGPNSDGKFTLAYILDNADTLIPTSRRHGGMTISFVDSSDNKYVQYFLKSQSFTTNEEDWGKMNLEEEVNQLGQEVVEKTWGNYLSELNLEQGSISSSNGQDESSTTRIRTNNYIVADKIGITTSGNKVFVVGYKNDGTYVSSQGWVNTNQEVGIEDADKYRLVFSYSDNANITPSDYNSLGITIKSLFFNKNMTKEEGQDLDYIKLDKKLGTNIINPEHLLAGAALKLNSTTGVPQTGLNATKYFVSEFIPVNESDIISNAYSASGTYTTMFIYDKDKNFLRNNGTDTQYTYQSGDGYVRISFSKGLHSEIQANYGTTLAPYEEYTDYLPIKQLQTGLNTKLSKSDVVDNCLTEDSEKALSAKQGVVLSAEIGKNTNAIDAISDTSYYTQLLTKDSTLSPAYTESDGVIKSASVQAYEFDVYAVQIGKRYKIAGNTYTGASYSVACFMTEVPAVGKTATVIQMGGVNGSLSLDYTAPANGYILIQKRDATTMGLSMYIPVITPKSKYVDIYVSPTGNDSTGDGSQANPYATIFHANETILDASENKIYNIHVADGIYTDLQSRYAGDLTTGTSYQGVVCKNYVNYIGNVEHPENVIIQWDGATGYDPSVFSYENPNKYAYRKCPFHVTEGKTSIKGFTIECTNTRYCLHIETQGRGRGVNWLVSDCIFIWHGTPDCPDRSTNMPPCIGTGSGFFEKGHLLRCIINNTEGVSPYGFRNHDTSWPYTGENSIVKEGADITIESCSFNNTDIQFRSMAITVDGYNRCQIINCTEISKLHYAIIGSATEMKWRASVKCSDIAINDFETNGYMQ